MAKENIEVLVEGGKATAAPPLGPALGPMGVNIGQVVAKINEKTAEFKGMQVPVKVIIDSETKKFDVEVGTPPASALIKKEAGVEKGAGNPLTDKVADLAIEQVIKIAKMKEDSLLGKDNIMRVKEICGTCNSMGVMVEGKPAAETIRNINAGKFRDEILKGKTELSAEEKKALDEEKKKLAAGIEARRHEFESKADSIVKSMEGKTRSEIKARLLAAEIPLEIVNEKLPAEAGAAAGAGAKPAAAKPAGKK